MGKVVYDVSMSLDGYIVAAKVRPEDGLSDGDERLHEWVFNSSYPRDYQFLGVQHPLANTPGIRPICFAIDNIEAPVTKLKTNGTELIGDIVNTKTHINYATFADQRELL